MEVAEATRRSLPAKRKRARKEWREDDAGGGGAVSQGGARGAAEAAGDGALRSRHLALLAEKSAADRGLEELVFGDAEEGEALLRRLRGRSSAQVCGELGGLRLSRGHQWGGLPGTSNRRAVSWDAAGSRGSGRGTAGVAPRVVPWVAGFLCVCVMQISHFGLFKSGSLANG